MKKITIVKVGGAVVEDAAQLDALLDNFSKIEGPKILVHGGGRRATKVAASLGIESVMVGGRRVTDAQMLEVVTMVYGGLVNKNLVAKLQANKVNAIGLTGADMDVIRSHKRPLKKMEVDGEEKMVDFGFVGDVDRADGKYPRHRGGKLGQECLEFGGRSGKPGGQFRKPERDLIYLADVGDISEDDRGHEAGDQVHRRADGDGTD